MHQAIEHATEKGVPRRVDQVSYYTITLWSKDLGQRCAITTICITHGSVT